MCTLLLFMSGALESCRKHTVYQYRQKNQSSLTITVCPFRGAKTGFSRSTMFVFGSHYIAKVVSEHTLGAVDSTRVRLLEIYSGVTVPNVINVKSVK